MPTLRSRKVRSCALQRIVTTLFHTPITVISKVAVLYETVRGSRINSCLRPNHWTFRGCSSQVRI